MTRRWVSVVVSVAAAVAIGGGAAYGLPRLMPSTMRFEVGGNAQDAANSLGAAWGAAVPTRAGSSWVIAAGDGAVICRILVDGAVVSEHRASGKGQKASCSYSG